MLPQLTGIQCDDLHNITRLPFAEVADLLVPECRISTGVGSILNPRIKTPTIPKRNYALHIQFPEH